MVGTSNVYRFLLHGHWKNRILMFNGIRLGDHSGCGCVSVISPMSGLFFFVTAGHMWGFPTMGDPQNCWFIMGNPIQMDENYGYPHFRKPPFSRTWVRLNTLKSHGFKTSVSPSINDNKRMYHPIVPNCSTTLLVDYTHLPTWISWILIRLIPINSIQNPIRNPIDFWTKPTSWKLPKILIDDNLIISINWWYIYIDIW